METATILEVYAPMARKLSKMAGGTRNVRLELSPAHFAILADAMCVFSKNTSRFQSFRATVQRACERLSCDDVEPDTLTKFLGGATSESPIVVWLEVKSDWSAEFDAARVKVARFCHKSLHDRLAIPYIVSLAMTRTQLR